MSLTIFPQRVTIFPEDRQIFTARADASPPLWIVISDGVVRPHGSLSGNFIGAGFFPEGDSALELASDIGSIEFTIDANCQPADGTPDGEFLITAFFKGTPTDGWQYRVHVSFTAVTIKDETGATLATIPHNVAAGDKFKIELANGFRLFINRTLAHERVTGFVGTITYPATYSAKLIPPLVGTRPEIPAPALEGAWQLRPKDRFDSNYFGFSTSPIEGGFFSPGPPRPSVEYGNGTKPGNYKVIVEISPGVEVWMEDSIPAGGEQLASGGDIWNFVASNPTSFSGSLSHKSQNIAGSHGHGFQNASVTMQMLAGDSVYVYVFPDTTNPTTEILIEWKVTDSTSFNHRAYWGANSINIGVDGTASRRFMGALPPAGLWTRLEVPASLIDLEGRVVSGMFFHNFNGQVAYDQAGKIPNLQRAEADLAIPPLRILGELTRTIQPGAKVRPQTNYDVAQTALITWSVLSGGGSFSQGEFTAPLSPGTTIVRATPSIGNQVADLVIKVPALITPNFIAAGPLEEIDWDSNLLLMPHFVAAGTPVAGTGGIIAPDLPPGLSEDDIMLLFVETANQIPTTPLNWAVADAQGIGPSGSAAATRLTVFWKRAVIGEEAPLLIASGDHVFAQIHSYRGCIRSGNPWDVTAGDDAAASTGVSIPGATTTVPNCLIVQAVANATDSLAPQASGYANAALANLTERANINTDEGNGGGFTVLTSEKAVAGPFGATTATLANASVQGRVTIALKPAVTVWTASGGIINSSTGEWIAPDDVGGKVQISVSDGAFTATRDVVILAKFPFADFAFPLEVDWQKRILTSESEDGTSFVARVKSRARQSFPWRLTKCSVADLQTLRAFWDRHHPGPRFIMENLEEESRLVVRADSDLRWEYTDRGINITGRVKEA